MPIKRVAITGIGIVSPLGNDAATSWHRLIAGERGIEPISRFDASEFAAQVAAEVKNFTLPAHLARQKQTKYATSFVRYALAAADEALHDASIKPTATTANRWGMVVGSGMITAEYEYWQRFSKACAIDGVVDKRQLGQKGNAFYSSVDFGKATANSGLGLLLQTYNIQGYANAVHTACASGGQALGLALQVIRRGEADCVLAGGFDSMINPVGLASFCLLGALSGHNEPPQTASRPFDLTRNGFVLGEGAAFLVLESWEKARARGATIYAELAGEGNSLSSYRITDSHPSGDGAIQAMHGALRDAGADTSQVDYINAHGTGTKMNDFSETNAIKAVFQQRAQHIAASSVKAQVGHLIAGAGALEAAFTSLAIHHNKIPMTANLTQPDPECDLDYVREGPRDQTIRVALSNSFGFGGSNSCVVLRNPEWVEA